jgi:HEAT repeat protein
MTSSPNSTPGPAPADSLPPVEPPSAGFIVQLFVIPAVIVTIIVIVWGLFNWLAHMGNDPRDYVQALRRNNESRWQEAVNLANELQKTGNDALKQDAVLAGELATLLDEEIETGGYEEKQVTLRVYLCRVLGEFHVPGVVPTLLKAARTNRDERESVVRLAALQGLARLMPTLDAKTLQSDAALRETLLTLSQESDPVVRYHAAYDLGVLGGEPALARLKTMLEDSDVDVRMNSATGLARHGDASCVAVLVTMIDPADPGLPAGMKEVWNRDGKALTVRWNALEAGLQLSQQNASADLAPLAAAVDKLIQSEPQADIRAKAEEVRQALAKRTTSGK